MSSTLRPVVITPPPEPDPEDGGSTSANRARQRSRWRRRLSQPKSLLSRILLSGDPPSPTAIPPGCRFHPRCPIAQDRCRIEVPEPRDVAPGHTVACHYARPWPLAEIVTARETAASAAAVPG